MDRATEGSSQGPAPQGPSWRSPVPFPTGQVRGRLGWRENEQSSRGGGHATRLEVACEAFRRLWGLNLENELGSQGLGSLILECAFYTSLGLCEMGILTGRSLDLRFPAWSLCCTGKWHGCPRPL